MCQRAENSQRPPIGYQHSKKIMHPEGASGGPYTIMHTSLPKMNTTLNSKQKNEPKP